MSETRAEDLTVLVIEDYEDMRLALERGGYHILEASVRPGLPLARARRRLQRLRLEAD